jgi:hypothetical protein
VRRKEAERLVETVLGDLQHRLESDKMLLSSGVQNALVDLCMVTYFETKNHSLTHSLTHGAERFFMEPEGSLPRSQEPSTGPYPEPDRSNPYHPTQSLTDQF